jgi:hypothetical protein
MVRTKEIAQMHLEGICAIIIKEDTSANVSTKKDDNKDDNKDDDDVSLLFNNDYIIILCALYTL